MLSLDNQLDYLSITEFITKKDFFQQMFYNYSAIKTLGFIYE